MLLAKASIGRKLLFSFLVMAMLVLLSTAIGVSGFSFVAKTERNVVDTAIPSMLEAREVSELSTRIIASVQTLSNAKTKEQHQEAGKVLFSRLEALLTHIKTLGSDSFDSQLLNELENYVQSIIDSLVELGVAVEQSITLDQSIDDEVELLRVKAEELEQLTRTQVLNTSTIAVANVTHIYRLLEQENKADALDALDSLVEVDLDLSERLHELHLLAFKTLNQIEESRTVSDLGRIEELQKDYQNNISIMTRRVKGVEDPARSKQMSELLAELSQGKRVFSLLTQKHNVRQRSKTLMQETLEQFTSLNSTVSKLVDQSNAATTKAVAELSSTLSFAQWTLTLLSIAGFVVVVLIVWRVVYVSVVKRLGEYSSALLSIAKGQLKVDVTVKGNDELAHMGQAIITARNTAQALKVVAEAEAAAKRELQEHKEHLEEIVADRTLQLQKSNERLNQEVLNHAKARNAAEQANRAKSAFLATMSHEIRTPMNGVLGTAALMEETPLNNQQQKFLDVINRSGQNLLAILNDVLDYSKIEAGHLEIRNKPFDLYRMIQDCYQLMLGKALEKGLDFKFHIESDVSDVYCGDVTRLSQVLNNLVGNAIKFTPSGQVDIYVSLDPDDETCVMIEVSDTGVGISPEDQLNLFDAFTQAENGYSTAGGTGLGLAISQKLVKAMNGAIYVDSYLEEGSRFWFVVPLEQCTIDKQEIIQPLGITKTVNGRILLIEDNAVNAMVAEGFLMNMGHHVICAESGHDAKHIFSHNDFDIVLVDINLPDCNGVDLMHQLREIEDSQAQKHHAPMIAVSAHVFSEEVESYLEAGFDGYLPKPVDREALKEMIQTKLKGRDFEMKNEEHVISTHEEPAIEQTGIIDPSVIEADIKVLGIERMAKIVDAFTRTSEQTLHELEQAAQIDNAKDIKALAHKMKGSAGSLGLSRLFEICLSIESSEDQLGRYLELLEPLVAAQRMSVDSLIAVLDKYTD
ncbi:TMAO reductase system sensor histidine kinase/response regulator TorS [Vibrio mediterranei]|uniref:histidine kinase n=1 Tax=Vibrio mediterranei TaxID=689 RepID=A0ABX5D581_9VIBR|nr:TMAO reductase system sensor histidine kinase/response regulator TorS [Vibrio mediterranei]PCD86077.1 TMAO reductase system sensor histidine kinase/response regulator TorS [Vibrio mediterranei]PRQ64840.1 TMAO reductase system sensor histidine kinase/response regulator TorS [Vibrio mediterranei]